MQKPKSYFIFICVALACFSCGSKTQNSFSQLTPVETGIDFTNHVPETDSINLLTYVYLFNGAGVAVGDINRDGLEDIFFQEIARERINCISIKASLSLKMQLPEQV